MMGTQEKTHTIGSIMLAAAESSLSFNLNANQTNLCAWTRGSSYCRAGSSSLTVGVMSSSSGTATVRRPARRSCSAWRSEAGRPERRPRAPQAALPAAAAKAWANGKRHFLMSRGWGLGLAPESWKNRAADGDTAYLEAVDRVIFGCLEPS